MKFERSEHKGTRIGGGGQLNVKLDKWEKPSLKRELILPMFDLTEALCGQTDPELFFPEKGGTTEPAKAICRQCTVQAECLNWAMTNREEFGIWGGLSPNEREALRKRRHTIPIKPLRGPTQTTRKE